MPRDDTIVTVGGVFPEQSNLILFVILNTVILTNGTRLHWSPWHLAITCEINLYATSKSYFSFPIIVHLGVVCFFISLFNFLLRYMPFHTLN